MESRKSGEGLHIIWEIIVKGVYYRWQSAKELFAEIWATTDDNKNAPVDWQSKREDYLSGDRP